MTLSLLLLPASFALAAAIAVFGGVFRDGAGLGGPRRIMQAIAMVLAGLAVWAGVVEIQAWRAADEPLECVPYAEARADAERRNVPLLIDFTADWCDACHRLRREVLDHPALVAQSDRFVCAEVDMTRPDADNLALQETYGVVGLPHLSFRNRNGERVLPYTFGGGATLEVLLFALRHVDDAAPPPPPAPTHRLGLGLWGLLLLYLAGVAASLTPCVYPLIPVTVAIFANRREGARGARFLAAALYVAGMAAMFTGLGIFAAMAGSMLGSVFQSTFVLLAMVALFAALGLSMLGWYEMRLPHGVTQRLAVTEQQGFVAPFLMGMVAGVLATPCVGPVLSGVLLVVAEGGSISAGAVQMMVFGVGVGTLFLVIALFAGAASKLPRSGPWMQIVKGVFAVGLSALAWRYLALLWPPLMEPLAWLFPGA